jgi:chromosomal replication initiator protein
MVVPTRLPAGTESQRETHDPRADVAESRLRAAVAERLGPSRFDLWFGEGVRLGIDGDALRVDVPSRYFHERIQTHFAGSLIEAAEALAGRPLRLDFAIAAEAVPQPGDVVQRPAPEPGVRNAPEPPPAPVSVPTPPKFRPASPDRPRPTSSARPARRLDDFVVGPNNRLAHAAALALVQAPGAAFNPLVVHGGIGMGKTHLLEGIAAGLRARLPGANIVHVTAEAFTNGFLDALRSGALGAFRARYRGADALIVDDVHFLAAKRGTQDEFQHTFDALVALGRPVVLSADQHPRLIARLTDELATRLLGGMVVKLDPPDAATRAAIVRAKASARAVELPEAVVAYIAEHLRASVRELEGALNSLIATAALTGKRLDLNLARAALRDTIRHTAQAVALKDVERAVCRTFALDAEALRSSSRARAVAHPRMLAMYLARKHSGAAYSEIGRYFGGRNHSTVIAAEKKVAAWLREEQRCALLPGFETMADALAAIERALGA